MSRVGLIGPSDRPELVRLGIRLEERGAEPVFLDPHRDPTVVLEPGGESACGEDLRDLRSVYVVDLGIPSFQAKAGEGEGPTAARAALARSMRHLAAWNALLERLALRMPVVNPPMADDVHALKPLESGVYMRAGFPVPHTVSSSDPEALAALPTEKGGWVVKGMVGGVAHTEGIDRPSTAEEAAALMSGCPRMVQERIEGDNIRAFVLDGKVLGAAEIVPVDGTEIDSRRSETRIRRVGVPPEAAEAALAAVKHWGMAFSGVDFMRDDRTGRWILLECNSAPFFVVFEGRSGVDVSGPLADYLVGRRKRAA